MREARPAPPPWLVTSDLEGGRFDRCSSSVALEAVAVSDMSFPGMRFEKLSVRGGCQFQGRDFSGVRSRYMS